VVGERVNKVPITTISLLKMLIYLSQGSVDEETKLTVTVAVGGGDEVNEVAVLETRDR
jgi:hypothetical protein